MKNIKENFYFFLFGIVLVIYSVWQILEPFVWGLVLAACLKPIHNRINLYVQNNFISSIISLLTTIFIIIFSGYVFKIFVYDDLLIFLTNNNTKLLAQSINAKFINISNSSNYISMTFVDRVINYFTWCVYQLLEGHNTLTLHVISFLIILPVSGIFFLNNLNNIYNFIYFEGVINDVITKQIKLAIHVFQNYYYTHLKCIRHMGLFFSLLLITSTIEKKLLYFYTTWVFIFIPTFASTVNLFIFLVLSAIQQNNCFFLKELLIFVFFYIYENYIFIPKYLGKIFQISNFTIWCIIIITGKIMGFLGMMIAIPLTTTIFNIYKDKEK